MIKRDVSRQQLNSCFHHACRDIAGAPGRDSKGCTAHPSVTAFFRHCSNWRPVALRAVRRYTRYCSHSCSFIFSLSLANKVAIPVELEAKDKLKLSFQVVDKDSGNGVQPHQTFLRFYDAETGEEGIQPIRVTSSGKAKFELVGGCTRQVVSWTNWS